MISDGLTQPVPLFFKVCLGEPDNTKVGIANKALIDWNIITKKKIGQKGCEWYEPATQNQRIRTFFGEVRKKYGWKLKQNDFNYRSMLNPMLEHIYRGRRSQYKMIDYGTPMPNRRLTEFEMSQIDLDKFNEDDPKQHIIKLAWAMGTQLGLRGGEYATLEVRQLTHDVFEEGHPCAGMKWFGLSGIQDKTMVLSSSNDYVRCDEEFMRSPVIPGDGKCLGGIIERYLPKIAPGQVRLFCRPFSDLERVSYIRNGKFFFLYSLFLFFSVHFILTILTNVSRWQSKSQI